MKTIVTGYIKNDLSQKVLNESNIYFHRNVIFSNQEKYLPDALYHEKVKIELINTENNENVIFFTSGATRFSNENVQLVKHLGFEKCILLLNDPLSTILRQISDGIDMYGARESRKILEHIIRIPISYLFYNEIVLQWYSIYKSKLTIVCYDDIDLRFGDSMNFLFEIANHEKGDCSLIKDFSQMRLNNIGSFIKSLSLNDNTLEFITNNPSCLYVPLTVLRRKYENFTKFGRLKKRYLSQINHITKLIDTRK